MPPAHAEPFPALLTCLFDVFDKPLHAGTIAMYADALAEFPLDLVSNAIRGACRDAQHFHRVPRPGDLRIRCGAPTVDTLMAQLEQALRDGYFAPPSDTPLVVSKLIRRLGGWKFINEHLDAETLRRRVAQLAPQLLAAEAISPRIPLPKLQEMNG